MRCGMVFIRVHVRAQGPQYVPSQNFFMYSYYKQFGLLCSQSKLFLLCTLFIHFLIGLPRLLLTLHSFSCILFTSWFSFILLTSTYNLKTSSLTTSFTLFFQFYKSFLLPFLILLILLIPSNPLKLFICSLLILNFSFSFQTTSYYPTLILGVKYSRVSIILHSKIKSILFTIVLNALATIHNNTQHTIYNTPKIFK